MKMRDGTEFKLGMKVVFESGREVQTDPNEHEIQTTIFEDGKLYSLHRKGSMSGMGIEMLYPSQEARINDQVHRLNSLKGRIDAEIELLKSGGSPNDCKLLHHTWS